MLWATPAPAKSTILNGLVGTAARGPRMPFRSGLSVASGRTIALQTDVVGGVRYSDTPGLDDVALKRRAAAAIADAVCLGGAVRLLFVLTMEAGRVRGANLATIRIVLDALTAAGVDVDGRFSVALNHGRDGRVGGPGHRRRGGAAVALGTRAAVDQLVYLPRVDGLVDAADAPFPAATRDCLAAAVDAMVAMAVPAGTHIDVAVDEVARLTAHYESELADHRRRVHALAEERESQSVRHEEATKEARKWNMMAGVVAAVASMIVYNTPVFP